MDNSKIHDSRLYNRDNQSIVQKLLDDKLQKSSKTTQSDFNSTISCSSPAQNVHKRILPDFKFSFIGYSINDSVQYQVELLQIFKVFKKTKILRYKFKTRYSKLEKLSEKLGAQGFPGKKLFGNKNPEFIEKRKKELQIYLNKAATKKLPEMLTFIRQIKTADLISDAKKPFLLD